MSKLRNAELRAAHHAEHGEHAEAATAEAEADVLRTEVGALHHTTTNILRLEAKAVALQARDAELTKQIIEAQIAGLEGDAELARERRQVRDEVQDLTETLTTLRQRRDEGNAAHSVHVLTDWLATVAVSEARVSRIRVEEQQRKIAALEEQLAGLRVAVAADYLRGNFFSDAADAVHLTFPSLAVEAIERPESIGREWDWEANRSPLRKLVGGDDLAGAVRAIPNLLASDDPAQVPGLGAAIEDLLRTHPPKGPDAINAERRAAVDAPHKAALHRVDTWLREELSAGPVPYATVVERAKAASIPIDNPGPDAPGWGSAYLGAAAQRLGVYPAVKYVGEDLDEQAAADQWVEDVEYWVRGVLPPGLMVRGDYARTAAQAKALR